MGGCVTKDLARRLALWRNVNYGSNLFITAFPNSRNFLMQGKGMWPSVAILTSGSRELK